MIPQHTILRAKVLSNYPGHFREPRWLSKGFPEISRHVIMVLIFKVLYSTQSLAGTQLPHMSAWCSFARPCIVLKAWLGHSYPTCQHGAHLQGPVLYSKPGWDTATPHVSMVLICKALYCTQSLAGTQLPHMSAWCSFARPCIVLKAWLGHSYPTCQHGAHLQGTVLYSKPGWDTATPHVSMVLICKALYCTQSLAGTQLPHMSAWCSFARPCIVLKAWLGHSYPTCQHGAHLQGTVLYSKPGWDTGNIGKKMLKILTHRSQHVLHIPSP